MTQPFNFGKPYQLSGEVETAAFAEELAALINPGMNIGLVGELGAGKTTLVRYLIKYLGSEQGVSSPTFVLSHEYNLPNGITAEHWDLYRLEGLPEDLRGNCPSRTVRFIEWADKAYGTDINFDLVLHISHANWDEPEKRLLVLEKAA